MEAGASGRVDLHDDSKFCRDTNGTAQFSGPLRPFKKPTSFGHCKLSQINQDKLQASKMIALAFQTSSLFAGSEGFTLPQLKQQYIILR